MKRKKKIIITALILCCFSFVFLIAAVTAMIGFLLAEQESSAADDNLIIPIEINGPFDGRDAKLTLTGEGVKVTGIKGSGDKTGFTARNKRNKNSMQTLSLPLDPPANLTNGFSYQPALRQENYIRTLSRTANAYKLANNLLPGKKMVREKSTGLAKVGNDYVIALGTAYHRGNVDVGYQRYQITIKNNGVSRIVTAILGDVKADIHTDPTHRFHESDGSVIEFHTYHRDKSTFTNPNTVFPGTVTKLAKIGGQAYVKIKVVIDGDQVTITGTYDGIPLQTTGTWKDGRIETSGFIGNVGDGKGLDAMVNWALSMAQGINAHGYSQPNRQCSICHGGKNHDYDCSSFTTAAVAHNGMGGADFVNACKGHAYSTSTIGAALQKNGWKNMGNLPVSKMKRGDIANKPGSHVEIYCGGGVFVGARNDKDDESGESHSEEIYASVTNHFWTEVWRFGGGR